MIDKFQGVALSEGAQQCIMSNDSDSATLSSARRNAWDHNTGVLESEVQPCPFYTPTISMEKHNFHDDLERQPSNSTQADHDDLTLDLAATVRSPRSNQPGNASKSKPLNDDESSLDIAVTLRSKSHSPSSDHGGSVTSGTSRYEIASMKSFRSSKNPLLSQLKADSKPAKDHQQHTDESLRSKYLVPGVIGFLVVLTLICAIVEQLQMPACAFQCLLIFMASVKWERDSYFAQASGGVPRPWRLCCQFFLTLIPLSCGFLLIVIFGIQQQELSRASTEE